MPPAMVPEPLARSPRALGGAAERGLGWEVLLLPSPSLPNTGTPGAERSFGLCPL